MNRLTVHIALLLSSLQLVAAAEKPATAPAQKPSIEEAARAKGGGKAVVRKNILAEISKYKDKSFQHQTSVSNKLDGFVTYAIPQEGKRERPYVAYLYLNWGDLDKLIPRCASRFYQNWDGQVKVQEAGYCSVVQEFAFDDGGNREPKVGTGIDKLLKDETSSQVRWLSAVVGATDGLLIRIEMQKSAARGEIKAGTYSASYEIRPLPAAPGK